MSLDNPLFTDQQVYSISDLNEVVDRLAQNDEYLRVITEALQQILRDTPGIPPSPAQLQAAIDALYASGSTIARNWIVDPPDRTLQEISNLFKIEPFASLIEGTKLKPNQWLSLLRLFGMLKGLVYLVEDGPNYDADPTYIKDGSFFFTAATDPNDSTKFLLVDAAGTPLTNGGNIYREIPIGVYPITLIEYLLRRLEFVRLRQLYRISAFEAGIDAKYDSAAPYDFIANAFRADTGINTRRMPCGFTSCGELLFLRSQAGKYRGNNLNIFRSDVLGGGVEERVIMAESTIQTPVGLFRLPKCVIRWDHLIDDAMRLADPDEGDPVFFVGLTVTTTVVKRVDYSNGTATPDSVSTVGVGQGIVFLEHDAIVAPIPNYPTTLSGTPAAKFPILTAEGHEQGRLIGYMQQDGLDKFGQYLQIQIDVALVPMHGRPFFDAATIVPAGQKDELGKMGEFGTTTDVAPWRAFGIGPRRVLKVVAPYFTGMTLDVDQGILVKEIRSADEATVICVLPVGLYLAKNGNPFGLDNLNGCTTRFTDAWAIRTITSAQISLNTIIFDDGTGNPDAFPEDFIGAELTIWHADGTTTKTTIIERVGDRLARIPASVIPLVVSGDIATIDRRKPSSSYDNTYNREVGTANFVDLRLRVCRMVDSVITTSSEGSPSPSPAVPWTELSHSRPDSLVKAAMAPYADKVAGIASKARWQYAQKFISLASQRQDVIDLSAGTQTDMSNFLARYIATYDANSSKEWVVGEDAIIHWPAKNPVTRISLRRYSPPVLPGQDDGLTIEEVEGWGPVPVLTKFLRSADNQRYPLRFVSPLVFASERSFQIPGHTKLAGSFRLQPEDTWIVDDIVTFQLFQTQNKNGVKQQVLIGSFDLNWTQASAFSNATGVFRIDGDASYNPSTGFVNINYNQIVDFTVDEPGNLSPNFIYHDLSEVHPIYKIDIGQLGLDVSHLFEVKGYSVAGGVITEMPDVIRLEGIGLASGSLYLRLNRDDVFKVIAAKGVFKTKWVLRGITWITIGKITNDENGVPASVEYTADQVRPAMTVSTLLENDSRCKQVYIPCATKYGWVDISQTNIHTESFPQNDSPKFGFFEKDSVKGTDTALTIPGPVQFAFKPSDIDYRFLESFTSSVGMEQIKSVAIARNYKTNELKTFVGVFREANGSGESTAFVDETTLSTVTNQDTIFLSDTEMTADWILDFAGMLVAVDDDSTASSPSGKSKLMLAGYWYGGHSVSERVGSFTRFRPDAAQFNSPTKNADYWRIGDVSMSFLYRGNNLLWSSRKRPL